MVSTTLRRRGQLGVRCLAVLLSSVLLCQCGDDCYCTDLLFEGTDEASTEELELVEAINGYRREEGLSSLTPSASLFAAAHRQAYDLQENELPLDHEGSDGSTVSDRTGDAGYSDDPSCVSENAHGLYDCGFVGVPCVLSSWQDSRGHDDNLLDDSARAVGIGIHGGITIAVFGCEEPVDPLPE